MGYKKFVVPFIASVVLLIFVLKYPTSQTPSLLHEPSESIFDLNSNPSQKDYENWNNGQSLKTAEYVIRNTTESIISKDEKVYKISPKPYSYHVVPNIVHFVRFTKCSHPLEFTEMMSILSAHKNQRPDVLYIHCNIEPTGEWWLELLTKVKVKVVHRDIPMRVGYNNISDLQHATEVTKLHILMEYGGIMLDTDVIVLNSLNDLRFYNFTMGKEKAPKLSSGIIIARNDSEFLHRWYRNYREDYKGIPSDYNCCTVPYKIAQKHVDLIHIEAIKLTTPDWMDKHLLYVFSNSNLIISWREFYVVHLMFHNREGRVYNPEYIKSLRNLVGKILRLIYYGTEDERSEYLPWVYYSKHPVIYETDFNHTSVKPFISKQ